MNRTIIICLLICQTISLVAQVEKIPLPRPSDHPYQQVLYHSSQREWSLADSMIDHAIDHYQKHHEKDSVLVCRLRRAWLLGFQGLLDQRAGMLRQLDPEISNVTQPKTRLFYHFLRAEVAFDFHRLEEADSLYDLAISQADAALGGCYGLRPDLYLGKAAIALYNFRILDMHTHALEMLACARLLYNDADMRTASYLNMMGMASYELKYFGNAIQYYTEALDLFRSEGVRKDAAAVLTMNIGNALVEQNNFSAATTHFEEALTHAEIDSNQYMIGLINYNLANCFYNMGYYQRAVDFGEESRNRSKKLDQLPPYYSFLLVMLGKTYSVQGDLERGMQYLAENRQHLSTTYGDAYQGLPYAYHASALALSHHNRYRESLSIYEEIFEMIRKHGWDPIEIDRANYLDDASRVALQLGDSKRAQDYCRQAIHDFRNTSGSARTNLSRSAARLADLWLSPYQPDSVRHYLQLAQDNLLGDSEAHSIDEVIPQAKWPSYRFLEEILTSKLKMRMAQYRSDGDLRNLKKGLAEVDQIMELISPHVAAYLTIDDLTSVIDKYIAQYEQTVKYCALMYEATNETDYLFQALRYVEKTKDLVRKINTNKSEHQGVESLDAEMLAREEFLMANIQRSQSQIHTLNQTAPEEAARLEDTLFSQQRQLDLFRSKLSETHPKYFELKYAVVEPEFSDVQEYVKKHQVTLLDFFWGAEDLHVFIIAEDEIFYHNLAPISTIDPMLTEAMEKIHRYIPSIELQSLHDYLMAPMETQIRGDRLAIIPDGKLHFLPFEALQPEVDHFLIEENTIWYAHSLDHLMSQPASHKNQVFLSIAPGFSDQLKNKLARNSGDMVSEDFARYLFQPNALSLTKSLRENFEGIFLLEHDATESNFRKSLADQGIIHLATHAQLDDRNPMYSRFSLVPDTVNHDGFLHAYEILDLSLTADLAVLPACQTGVGRIHRGQGVTSLSNAFRTAGCQNMLMSLWSIDEQQSMGILTDFYDLLRQGTSGVDALNTSKRAYLSRTSGKLRHPGYWAGLVLVGNGLPASAVSLHWIFPCALLLVMCAFFLRRRRVQRG